MSVDAVIQQALDPIFPGAVFPNCYDGELLEYVAYTYEQIPEVYAERAPRAARYLLRISYFLKHGTNPNPGKQRISRALFEAGCTWPEIINGSDGDGQMYVFDCEYADGGGYYGQP